MEMKKKKNRLKFIKKSFVTLVRSILIEHFGKYCVSEKTQYFFKKVIVFYIRVYRRPFVCYIFFQNEEVNLRFEGIEFKDGFFPEIEFKEKYFLKDLTIKSLIAFSKFIKESY